MPWKVPSLGGEMVFFIKKLKKLKSVLVFLKKKWPLISRMLPQSLIWFKLKKPCFYKINSFIFNRVSPCIHGDMNFFKLQIFYVQYIWVAPILEKINKVCLKLNSYINFHFREGRLYKIISYLKILPQGGQFLFGIVVIWLFF